MEGGVWRSRGYLPHFEDGCRPVFLTWRLADALTEEDLHRIHLASEDVEVEKRRAALGRMVEEHLDRGEGTCVLREARFAGIVEACLIEEAKRGAKLFAWVVMSNHVHVVVLPPPGDKVGGMMRRIKGRSARFINQARGASGRLWQVEYFDRTIRDAEHMERCVKYVEWNPVKAKLVFAPEKHRWSSAWHRERGRFDLGWYGEAG